MTSIQTHSRPRGWRACALPLLILVTLAGCGGSGLDPVLGATVATNLPTVANTLPAATAPITTGVSINTLVQATFNKPMLASSITSGSFSLACPAGTPVAATVSYDAASQVASLRPAAPLPPSTTCQATVGTGAQDSNGIALASAFVWSFTTGLAVAADTTRPTVTLTNPAAGSLLVANNSVITATFSEPMTAASLTASSFTVTNTTLGTSVAGTVAYSSAASTATFTPAAPGTLANGSLFTATVTTAATDLAGNGLTANKVWTFTTGAVADTSAPTVTAISPQDASTAICLGKSVSATFSEPMNPASLNTATYTVTDGGVAVAGTVSYDAASQIATFKPTAAAGFAANRSFVVTIVSGAAGVKDLAGNPLASNRNWDFTTSALACGATTSPVDLGLAASFGAFGGGAGVTNQGINTVVGGNLGSTAACTLITGFHDATNVYTQTPLNIGSVNGSINCAPPAPGTAATLAVATQARADAQAAYNALAALPPGSDPAAGQLGGLVLPAAVYTAAGGTFAVTSGDLTLDAQGDVNAVWVFQSAAALTVGLPATPRRVFLINGAQAKNVFWQVGSAARIEDGSAMVGTIIAPAGVTISTAGQTIQTTLVGRAIGLTASVTLVNTTVVAP
ncbi:Ig-like domain-containing protein [Roseateles sp.]|uniref:Ig-like domain-containing protein n=1 Tax=Roseateles sp. TaxID=1971397 RepID=UPI0032672C7A